MAKAFAVPMISFEYGKATGTKGYWLFGEEAAAKGFAEKSNAKIPKGADRYEHAGQIQAFEPKPEAERMIAEGAFERDLWKVRA